MTTPSQPAGRSSGQPRQKPVGRRPRARRQERDPYRPEYSVVLAVSPQMRARYPHSPLSLDEALQRGSTQSDVGPAATEKPGATAAEPAAQHVRGGQTFWAELPGNLRAPCRARAAVRHVLASWGLSSLTGDAELLASELVANAAEHGPGQPIGLLIRQTATDAGQPGIHCEVTDTSRQIPGTEPAHPDSERGRGLNIIATLATESGYLTRPGGKTAWFTLTTQEPARAAELEAGA